MDVKYKKCGYQELCPCQYEVVDAITKIKDCIICTPTGSGKSLAFEIAPYLLHDIDHQINHEHEDYNSSLTVIVSPLVALMKSQTNDLNSRGISTHYLGDISDDTSCQHSSVEQEGATGLTGTASDKTVIEDIEFQITSQLYGLTDLFSGKVNILFASPESLLSKRVRKLLKKVHYMVKSLVVNEAHCIIKLQVNFYTK